MPYLPYSRTQESLRNLGETLRNMSVQKTQSEMANAENRAKMADLGLRRTDIETRGNISLAELANAKQAATIKAQQDAEQWAATQEHQKNLERMAQDKLDTEKGDRETRPLIDWLVDPNLQGDDREKAKTILINNMDFDENTRNLFRMTADRDTANKLILQMQADNAELKRLAGKTDDTTNKDIITYNNEINKVDAAINKIKTLKIITEEMLKNDPVLAATYAFTGLGVGQELTQADRDRATNELMKQRNGYIYKRDELMRPQLEEQSRAIINELNQSFPPAEWIGKGAKKDPVTNKRYMSNGLTWDEIVPGRQ